MVETAQPAGGAQAGDGSAEAAAHLHTSGADLGALRERLEGWLGGRLEDPAVSPLAQPEGNGVSSDTVLFEVTAGPAGDRQVLRCVARIEPDPAGHRVFPRYDLAGQARILRLVAERTAVPVPAVLWEEPDPGPLGAPFFVMERVDGQVPPDVMPYPFGSWVTEATPEQRRVLQDGAVAALAGLHTMDVAPGELSFLDPDAAAGGVGGGGSPLRRHVDASRRYYEWVVEQGDGRRSAVLDDGFAWLEANWPAGEPPAGLSWGDARIGNMLFRDFRPVALLDWEMAGIGPGAVDVGWMVFLHRFLDDIAVEVGLSGLPDMLRPDDVAATYAAAGGAALDDLTFYATYAAVRMGGIILREQERPLLTGGLPLPDDLDELVIHRRSLRAMVDGDYWAAWTG